MELIFQLVDLPLWELMLTFFREARGRVKTKHRT